MSERFKPHFNFITLHYCYIIGTVLLGSVLVYVGKGVPYIDALFFSSGACTQSGLNTIDLNLINTYQQVLLYVFPMLTGPIFINTCVVAIRLRWFEKRFQNIVKMSRLPSRARSLTREPKGDNDSAMEQGIRGRHIRVLHNNRHNSGPVAIVKGPDGTIMQNSSDPEPDTRPGSPRRGEVAERSPSPEASSSTIADLQPPTERSEQSPGRPPVTASSNIQFTDLPSPRDGADESGHIAFAERPKAPQRERALRIPGPREFEKGDRAREVDDDDTYTLAPTKTAGDETTLRNTNQAPSRSYSFSAATTNASMRLRKLPTADMILPHATTVMSSAFTVGTARHRRSFSVFNNKQPKEVPPMPYLSYQPTIARNSQFVDLTDEQRDELGGIEYRSLKLLFKLLVGYYIFFHLFGVLSLLPWIYNAPEYAALVRNAGINVTWWAVYTAQSAFNNLGFALTPDSMLSFHNCTWVLLSLAFIIVIGNTGFPCLLRFLIWGFFKLAPKDSAIKECLNFLLDHPRRCFTLLFPSRETWVLFWVLVGLNVSDVILFIVLDLKNPDVTTIKVGYRIVDAIFQAASTRTAGLAVVNLAAVHPAVQVSYMLMMYISVFPIAISVRRTNVYEEKSLGVWHDEEEDDGTGGSYVGIHLRKQLSFDLWYIFLGLFIICIAEGRNLENTNDYGFTIFSVLFEVVSAYGTVGLSLGYPGLNASFSAKFSTVSKLVIIAMQIRGRHRGLPYELDRAILLPKEQQDAEMMSIRRRGSNLSTAHPFPQTPSISRPVPSQAIED